MTLRDIFVPEQVWEGRLRYHLWISCQCMESWCVCALSAFFWKYGQQLSWYPQRGPLHYTPPNTALCPHVGWARVCLVMKILMLYRHVKSRILIPWHSDTICYCLVKVLKSYRHQGFILLTWKFIFSTGHVNGGFQFNLRNVRKPSPEIFKQNFPRNVNKRWLVMPWSGLHLDLCHSCFVLELWFVQKTHSRECSSH